MLPAFSADLFFPASAAVSAYRFTVHCVHEMVCSYRLHMRRQQSAAANTLHVPLNLQTQRSVDCCRTLHPPTLYQSETEPLELVNPATKSSAPPVSIHPSLQNVRWNRAQRKRL
uniref:Putative N6-adenosine-methyltransferase MT-A70-like protein n=1 Tax=Lygus hesperus TaxID=30085 RepID=A0A0A9Y7W2_LYGHE